MPTPFLLPERDVRPQPPLAPPGEVYEVPQMEYGLSPITFTEGQIGVLDERGFPVVKETFDDTPGFGGLGLMDELAEVARNNELQVIAYKLGLDVENREGVFINNYPYSATGEAMRLAIENGGINTALLPPDSNWVISINSISRTLADMQERENAPTIRFLQKVGPAPQSSAVEGGSNVPPPPTSEVDPNNPPPPPRNHPDDIDSQAFTFGALEHTTSGMRSRGGNALV